MKLLNILNKTIEYSFYLLFFLVPLALTGDTSELFEFNKLWVTFIIAIVIGVAWVWKMIIKGKFSIQRTPMDIPIGIFLVSEIISTFISLDTHTSLWGYYSRFNGGLFSIIAYIFLFYAFVSNLKEENNESEKEHKFDVKKIYIFIAGIVVFFAGTLVASQIPASQSAGIPFQMLATLVASLASFGILMKAAPTGKLQRSIYAILSSAVIVVLWGLPSHFGYDPTCLLFRGTLDVSCWTADFQPKIRIFSTLGQPDWLGAYLAALIPIIGALLINFSRGKTFWNKKLASLKNINNLIIASYFVFFILSFVALLYSQSKSIVIAAWTMIPLFFVAYLWFYHKPKFDRKNLNLSFKVALILLISIFAVTFVVGQPIAKLEQFTLKGVISNLKTLTAHKAPSKSPSKTAPAAATELGGTDSGTIRLLVWEGAINIWKANPIFGTGVETYAYAYYLYRPAAHNLTSEWQYLYNKAHNEYLNYLATTGTVGFLSYLSMIGMFLFVSIKHLFERRKKLSQDDVLIGAILAGYGTILITNFFGFSVVMINILFYLSPAFVLLLAKKLDYDKKYSFSFSKAESVNLSTPRKISLAIALIVGGFMIYTLVTFWQADRLYYFGYNFDHQVGDYQKAYPFLKDAVDKRPTEPVFRDEYAFNNAILGASIIAQLQQQKTNNQQNLQIAKQLIETAITETNRVTTEHPNNVVFWKTKVRIYYTLGQIDPSYLTDALAAIKKAHALAPTDADVSYNLGILYGQTGNAKDAIKTLQDTIVLKKDYFNAYYALGIFYHQLSVDQKGVVVNKDYAKAAIDQMKLTIKIFGPNQQVQQALNAWSKM
jgi:O-antigen ligase